MSKFLISLDQGTTSTRAIVFDQDARPIASAQIEHIQYFPNPGWVEHDAAEIWINAQKVLTEALSKANISSSQILALGITNQRETTVVWDRVTGKPVYPAIVWQDTRTKPEIDSLTLKYGADFFRTKTGLPPNSYFSASKIAWILNKSPKHRKLAEAGDLLFGTIDSWLLWNLTGGPVGGVHKTDVTNASRTLLMDIRTLSWDTQLCDIFDIPPAMLPKISSSAEIFGEIRAPLPLSGVPIAGILGDQQSATFGQTAFEAGSAKNTYGTGNFLLVNTGQELVYSTSGLITAVAYQLPGQSPYYALEGSIAVTGSLVQWLRDNLGIINSSFEVESLAESVPDTGGAYFVPAFSGLFAPHWRSDARGVIVGLTRFVNKAHIARAVLEATAFQTKDVLNSVNEDLPTELTELLVDGGMVKNNLLMQFQADILGIPVVRPEVTETTALGAAFAAGLGVKHWRNTAELSANWQENQRWLPTMTERERSIRYWEWQKAVDRSLGWVD